MKVYCNECIQPYDISEGQIVLSKCNCGEPNTESNTYETSFYCNRCYSTFVKDDFIELDYKIVNKENL